MLGVWLVVWQYGGGGGGVCMAAAGGVEFRRAMPRYRQSVRER